VNFNNQPYNYEEYDMSLSISSTINHILILKINDKECKKCGRGGGEGKKKCDFLP